MNYKNFSALVIATIGSSLVLCSCFQHAKVSSEMKSQLDASVEKGQSPVILSPSQNVDLVMIVAPYVTETGITKNPLSSLIRKEVIDDIIEDSSFQDNFQIIALYRGRIVDRSALSNNMRISGSVLLITGDTRFAVDLSVDEENARPVEIVEAESE